MHEAQYYETRKGLVTCLLCPRKCKINPGFVGFCQARKNIAGKLYSLSYNSPAAIAIDPIEKKPLYHFLPGSKAFSVGTAGCNLYCLNCQNDSLSRAPAGVTGKCVQPEEIVKAAVAAGCESIAYTYNEPIVFYEYMVDIARLAKKSKIKNVAVSNGYINKEPLKKLCEHIDAFNIDLKGFDNRFYKKVCSAELEPILESLKTIHKSGAWLEVTNLMIPTLNDDMLKFKDMCIWMQKSLGRETPLHISRFFPMFKLQDTEPTPEKSLIKARDVAKKHLDYVYVGNIQDSSLSSTICPKCKAVLVKRSICGVETNALKEGRCSCGHTIPGVWK